MALILASMVVEVSKLVSFSIHEYFCYSIVLESSNLTNSSVGTRYMVRSIVGSHMLRFDHLCEFVTSWSNNSTTYKAATRPVGILSINCGLLFLADDELR